MNKKSKIRNPVGVCSQKLVQWNNYNRNNYRFFFKFGAQSHESNTDFIKRMSVQCLFSLSDSHGT